MVKNHYRLILKLNYVIGHIRQKHLTMQYQI